MSNYFFPTRNLKGYLERDTFSKEFAVLLERDNIYYEKPKRKYAMKKKVLRLGLIQWPMSPSKDIETLMEQAECFIDAVVGYRSDFALFPEFSNAPLMAKNNHLSEPEAIRELARHTV